LKLSQEFIINLGSQVDKLKSQLHKLETAKSVDEITVEDVYEIKPELREKIHQMIRDDQWAVVDDSADKKETQSSQSAAETVKEKLIIFD
jgi:hypothetical protein